jgi:fructose/tagatose bisphosphate aldolase
MRRAIAIEVRKARIIITVIKTEAAWRWFISWWKMNHEKTSSLAGYCTKWHQHVAENIPVHLCWHKDHFHQLQQLKDHGQSNQLYIK